MQPTTSGNINQDQPLAFMKQETQQMQTSSPQKPPQYLITFKVNTTITKTKNKSQPGSVHIVY